MSFYQSIYGNLPQSGFTYTTNNLSTDNVVTENLSAVNASIVNLTTAIFEPISITTTTITTNELNASLINASHMHISNISMDGTLGGHTVNIVTLNADHTITDALYINEQSAVLTDKSVIKRDANQVMFIGKNSSTDVTGADFLFKTGEESGGVKLRIPRTSDIVEVIALAADTTIQSTTGIFSAVNVSDLNVADTTTLRDLEVLNEASIRNLTVIGPNGLTATKGTITNLSSTKATLTNASITNLSISGDFNASGTSRFYNLTAEYFQSYITGVFQDMDAVTGNITTFESNNISNNILIKTANLSAVNTSISNNLRVGSNILCDSMNVTTVLTASTLSAATVNAGILLNASTMNALLVNTSNLSAINLSAVNASVDNNLNVRFGVTCGTVNTSVSVTAPKFNGTNISATNISATRITGDVSQNLSAGFGIALTTVSGVTTIANTGGSVTDPLNLSTLNASTINVSTLNADEIEGFTKSTEYAFQVTSTQNNNQTINVGTILNFNLVETETPPPVLVSGFVSEGYDPVLKQYIIPVDGYYQFGFKAFIQDTSDAEFRIGMFKSGALVGQGGRRSAMTEDFTIILNCVKGQYIDLRGHLGSGDVYMGGTHSWFWGYKLTPANNQIVSTTNLSIQNLSVADDITALNIIGNISQNLSAGFGIALTTVGGVTTIANTGGSVTDPLNLSTLNASTINVSLLNADEIEGFTQSTEYGFKSTCDYESIPISTVVTIPNGGTVPFNEHSAIGVSPINAYCIPDVLAYNKGLAEYTIPVSGYYLFGWRIFVLSSPTTTPHLRFTINNSIGVQVGEYASNNESCTFQGYFEAGNTIKVANGGAGSIDLDLARTRSYWYGHKLTPANNLITSTTNLSIQNLSVADEMTATTIKATNISSTDLTIATSLTGAGSINITGDVSAGIISATTLTGNIAGNLAAAYGIELSSSLGVTSITTNPSYFSANLTSNYLPGGGNQYTLIYDTVPYVPVGYSYNFGTGVLTVNNAGTYEISASANMDVVSYTDRVTLRARLRINGSWTVGLPQSYSYMRHQNYGMYGTSSISPIIQILDAGDTIDITCNVNKGNTTTFNSDFSGLQFFNGCNILVKRLH